MGSYEIWYVEVTRIGKIVRYVKPFFIEFPQCDCSFSEYLPQTASECSN